MVPQDELVPPGGSFETLPQAAFRQPAPTPVSSNKRRHARHRSEAWAAADFENRHHSRPSTAASTLPTTPSAMTFGSPSNSRESLIGHPRAGPYPRSPARSYDDSSASSNTSPAPMPRLPPMQHHSPHTSHIDLMGAPGLRQPGPYGVPPHPPLLLSQPPASRHWPPPPYQDMPPGIHGKPPPGHHETTFLPPIHGSLIGQEPGLGPGHGHGHGSQPGMLQPPPLGPIDHRGKRQYRQRRKDPSCDACRERKVKCDATESTSCSECTSRSVKCQFTKETNRRMSSMKQVQDLMNQVEELRNETDVLRQQLHKQDPLAGGMDVDHDSSASEGDRRRGGAADDGLFRRRALPAIGSQTRPRKRPLFLGGLEGPREFAHRHARGVWKTTSAPRTKPNPEPTAPVPPPLHLHHHHSGSGHQAPPCLPPRNAADELLHSYYRFVHPLFPVVHFPALHSFVDELYTRYGPHQQGLPQGPPPDPAQLSVFYGVLAAGSLFGDRPSQVRFEQPAELLEMSRELLSPWNDDVTLDNVRSLALMAFCLFEMNLRSAAWLTVGSAVRAAQDIGLHMEPTSVDGPYRKPQEQQQQQQADWTNVEAEMRRRLWWAVYMLERNLSAEVGRPSMIDDDDCDVALPTPDEDHPAPSPLQPVIDTARAYGPLLRVLSAPTVSPTLAASFEQHFVDCAALLPAECDTASSAPLQPQLLQALVQLFSARLLLHRHSLGPESTLEIRQAAARQCMHISSETAQLAQRLSVSVSDAAPAQLVLHAFRCCVIALWTGCFDAATTMLRLLAAVGEARSAVAPCGRFIAHFVALLADKRADYAARLGQQAAAAAGSADTDREMTPPHGHGSARLQAALLHDWELAALVGGNVQTRLGGVWGPLLGDPGATAGLAPGSRGLWLLSIEARSGMGAAEAADWAVNGDGWKRLGHAVGMLAADGGGAAAVSVAWGQTEARTQQRNMSPMPRLMETGPPPPPGPTPPPPQLQPQSHRTATRGGVEGAAAAAAPTDHHGNPAASTSSRRSSENRMSIANII